MSDLIVDVTPGEVRIRKSAKLLARRLLKEDDDNSVDLVVLLLRRAQRDSDNHVVVVRETYAFLLQNGVTEKVAWDATGMADI